MTEQVKVDPDGCGGMYAHAARAGARVLGALTSPTQVVPFSMDAAIDDHHAWPRGTPTPATSDEEATEPERRQ